MKRFLCITLLLLVGFSAFAWKKAEYGVAGALSTSSGFAAGNKALAKNDSVQLGTGTNITENTLKVYNNLLLGADGQVFGDGFVVGHGNPNTGLQATDVTITRTSVPFPDNLSELWSDGDSVLQDIPFEYIYRKTESAYNNPNRNDHGLVYIIGNGFQYDLDIPENATAVICRFDPTSTPYFNKKCYFIGDGLYSADGVYIGAGFYDISVNEVVPLSDAGLQDNYIWNKGSRLLSNIPEQTRVLGAGESGANEFILNQDNIGGTLNRINVTFDNPSEQTFNTSRIAIENRSDRDFNLNALGYLRGSDIRCISQANSTPVNMDFENTMGLDFTSYGIQNSLIYHALISSVKNMTYSSGFSITNLYGSIVNARLVYCDGFDLNTVDSSIICDYNYGGKETLLKNLRSVIGASYEGNQYPTQATVVTNVTAGIYAFGDGGVLTNSGSIAISSTHISSVENDAIHAGKCIMKNGYAIYDGETKSSVQNGIDATIQVSGTNWTFKGGILIGHNP